VVGVCHSVN